MDKPKTMRPVYQVTAVLIFVASLFLVHGSLEFRYYTAIGPGPGFFPLWLSGILAVLAVLMFFHATFTKSPDKAPDRIFPDASGFLRMATIPVALGVAALLLERIGFGPAMFLMNLFVMSVLAKRHFLLVLVIALISSFGIEYVFTQWLYVILPKTNLWALCPQFICGG